MKSSFIIKIDKSVCEEKGIDPKGHYIGRSYDNKFCMYWQEFETYYEFKMNSYWAVGIINRFGLTDYDIEIYLTKPVKIRLTSATLCVAIWIFFLVVPV